MSKSADRVHLTDASPIGLIQNVHCILWTFWGYHVQLGILVVATLYKLYSLSKIKKIQFKYFNLCISQLPSLTDNNFHLHFNALIQILKF